MGIGTGKRRERHDDFVPVSGRREALTEQRERP
jgi:hypothetical protein